VEENLRQLGRDHLDVVNLRKPRWPASRTATAWVMALTWSAPFAARLPPANGPGTEDERSGSDIDFGLFIRESSSRPRPFVLFNNCYGDYAQVSARQLAGLLRG
jgi:hypothetical protein